MKAAQAWTIWSWIAANRAQAMTHCGSASGSKPAMFSKTDPANNRRLRDECLYEPLFRSLPAARTIIAAWRVDENTCRPHTSPGGLTPNACATRSKPAQNQNGLWL